MLEGILSMSSITMRVGRRFSEGACMARIVGWRERAALPGLGISDMSAKMDTGALSCSLHAEDIEITNHDGTNRVRFRPAGCDEVCSAPLLEMRSVKDSGGHVTVRPFILTELVLGGERLSVELSLIDRAPMRHPLIVGRRALRGRFTVDAESADLLGVPELNAQKEPGSRPTKRSETSQRRSATSRLRASLMPRRGLRRAQ